eukprot:6185494-Pleurochrysis_carterae.AAC.6
MLRGAQRQTIRAVLAPGGAGARRAAGPRCRTPFGARAVAVNPRDINLVICLSSATFKCPEFIPRRASCKQSSGTLNQNNITKDQHKTYMCTALYLIEGRAIIDIVTNNDADAFNSQTSL